jgi:hypothetical protein
MNYCKAIFFFYLLLFFVPVTSKAQSINGMVTACAGKQPLADVTVRIAEENIAVTTDNNGKYLIFNKIVRGGKYTLEFSFAGMKTLRKDIEISSKTGNPNETVIIDICMEDAAAQLDEVVVVAKSKVQSVKNLPTGLFSASIRGKVTRKCKMEFAKILVTDKNTAKTERLCLRYSMLNAIFSQKDLTCG